ncbi:MAG: hypothetical protein HKO85_08975 [Xanthomonadales bacterium]|jgi:hypothetical protein|nr:hypothetical protein [Gammaproteobacteria bacterium]MBT8051932.1 hypothetical protein [Gammaproteobacteria bacterium]MBT8055408.1 hypothetical protein [Gammaproteobacteria bacterium]NNJ79663.1 hypothetical protein [Xanthomonadales bacterium]NNL05412.1 hypothetical protein [Xanthomonadales bacterium]
MDTFAEIRMHISELYELTTDEPFIVSFEFPVNKGRRQSIFLAELETENGRRVLRVETPVAPLADLDSEKCLRINLMQRVGYLAVGDMDGVPYIKMCENLPYAFVGEDELDYTIRNVATTADKMEQYLEPGDDLT